MVYLENRAGHEHESIYYSNRPWKYLMEIMEKHYRES